MSETGATYTEAVQEGAKMVSMPAAFSIKKVDDDPIEHENKKSKPFDDAAKSYNNSQDITGTIAERYLKEHRNLSVIDVADLKFNNKIFTHESDSKYEPAMISAFRNAKGEISAYEAQYIERDTYNKSSLPTQKRSYGSKHGSAVILTDNSKSMNNLSIISESVITGLSVNDAYPDEHNLAAGGIELISSLDPDMLNDNVLICADNDSKDLSAIKTLLKA
ncbi:hypothetical protein OAO18_04070 [Francisellaceae bacterium]|nr:hypothetical protein [Francisellaceae bacterium]